MILIVAAGFSCRHYILRNTDEKTTYKAGCNGYSIYHIAVYSKYCT